MRYLATGFILIVLVIGTSCSPGDEKNRTQQQDAQKPTTEQQKVEQSAPRGDENEEKAKSKSVFKTYAYTAPYVCPNHCEGSGSESPGECQVCGMELMKNPRKQ